MRILLATAGSRGDVEPFVALAEHARASGHDVRLVAPDNTGVDTGDVDTVSMGVDYTRMIEDQGVSLGAALRNYRSVVRPVMRGVILGAARAAWDYRPDIIVYHPKVLSAPVVGDALGIPHVLAEIVPSMTPTRHFPAAGTLTRGIGPLNRLTYRAAAASAGMFRTDLAETRRIVGTADRRPSPPAATLMPISPAVLTRPDDWPTSVQLTGPWVRTRPPEPLAPELADFVAAGPYLYAGFGSMAMGDAANRGQAIVEAARARGIRSLIATGLGGIEIPEAARGADVLIARSVPHDQVLPGASIAVHHGGIGTVHAALRAATPSVIVPFIADQPFWGARLHESGLAPAPIRQRAFSSVTLTRALDDSERYRPRVTEIAAQMAAEHGAADALAVLAAIR